MKRSDDGEVRQASGIINTAVRVAMAREKARVARRRSTQPSAFEQAAAEWERQGEAKARKAEEERLRASREVEVCPFSFQQVQLSAKSTEVEDEVGWKPCGPEPEKREKKGTNTIVTTRVNAAGVCLLSQRLMITERAKALGRKPVDLRVYALEEAGRRWAEQRDRRK